MHDIAAFLHSNAEGDLFSFSVQQKAAKRYSLHLAEVEGIALANGLLPARYQRNRSMFSIQQQLCLLQSKVAVFGCGGLGGYIIEELARLGIGSIRVVDPDVFEEHNLNRQLLCTGALLGKKKAEAAVRRVSEINPAVRLQSFDTAFGRHSAPEMLEDIHVAADALDTISSRLELADACSERVIPLVHGAIAGWSGYMAVQYPGETILRRLYEGNLADRGVERRLGNPSFTPAIIASLEVAEIVKILLKIEPSRPRTYLAIDLLHMEFTEVPLPD